VLEAVLEAALEVERRLWKVRLEPEGVEVDHNIRR
jgi:hypothetical protein